MKFLSGFSYTGKTVREIEETEKRIKERGEKVLISPIPKSVHDELLKDVIETEEKYHFIASSLDMWRSLYNYLKKRLSKNLLSSSEENDLFDLNFYKEGDKKKFKITIKNELVAKKLGIPQEIEYPIETSSDIWKFHLHIIDLVSQQ